MIERVRNTIIPALTRFCGAPIIEADQTGNRPSGPHATFKFTSTRIKDVGKAEETGQYEAFFTAPHTITEVYQIKRVEQLKIVISLTAVDDSVDGSIDLANKLHDWFEFYGSDLLDTNKIAVVSKTSIQNRDVFISEDFERRNGFDITMRITQIIYKDTSFIEKVEGITN